MKPISKTAFYTCGVRMQDAESRHPVCSDVYAQRFMNEDARRIFEDFKDEASPNASIVARHRIIDDLLRQELAAADLLVIVIGAGFDSRAFRLPGGAWVELDEPQVIAYKNECLPVTDCENRLNRIAIDFAAESLEEKLSAFSTERLTAVVIEGVFAYLDETEIEHLLEVLTRLFPRHKLICDLMNRQFFEENGKTLHEKINGVGASFKFIADEPEAIFLENGYRRAEKISIVGRAVDLNLLQIPKNVLETSLQNLAEGNAVYVFETT